MGQALILASTLTKIADRILPFLLKAPRVLKAVRIPTAANLYDNPDWMHEETQALMNIGFTFTDCDIEGKSAAEIAAALAEADIVYVVGGNTYYLLEQMKKCGFRQIIEKCLNRGAAYIGCSAGAIVTGPRIDFIGDMDDRNIAGLKDFTGLGLVPFLLLTHLDNPQYAALAQKIAAEHEAAELMIGLQDDQLVCVNGGYISFC